jgi:transposase
MARELLPDALWNELKDLIPAHRPHPKGGHDWADDRLCLRGILFVLRTGIQWTDLPAEAFGVSGVTCWRRLRDWTAAGTWPAMHARVLRDLEAAGGVDHSLGVIDSASVRAVKGGRIPDPIPRTGPNAAASAI